MYRCHKPSLWPCFIHQPLISRVVKSYDFTSEEGRFTNAPQIHSIRALEVVAPMVETNFLRNIGLCIHEVEATIIICKRLWDIDSKYLIYMRDETRVRNQLIIMIFFIYENCANELQVCSQNFPNICKEEETSLLALLRLHYGNGVLLGFVESM